MTTATAAAPQHIQALEEANRIRLDHAALKREIAAMEMREAAEYVAHLLMHPTGSFRRIPLGHLLRAIPYFGPTKIARLLKWADLPGDVAERRVGPCPRNGSRRILTERQRQAVAAHLLAYARGLA